MARIIYHCYGGSHSSVTAAGIHLGLLPRERTARADELLKVPHFDRRESITHGHFRFIGRDRSGNEIFVLGKRRAGRDLSVHLYRVAKIFGCENRICLVDTTKPINLLMIVGGFLSRGLRAASLGRPLVLLGTRLAYSYLLRLVEKVQEDIREGQATAVNGEEVSLPQRRALFYICPEKDPLAVLTAMLHLQPGLPEDVLLDRFFLLKSQFTGKLGEVYFVGKTAGYDVYLLGAGREPQILSRIMREMRNLIEIPQNYLMIAESSGTPVFLRLTSRLFLLPGMFRMLRLLTRAILSLSLDYCLRESLRIKLAIKEGILD